MAVREENYGRWERWERETKRGIREDGGDKGVKDWQTVEAEGVIKRNCVILGEPEE